MHVRTVQIQVYCNVYDCMYSTYALIELAESAAGYGWLVAPVHLRDLITLHVGYLILCEISCERNL